MSGTWPDSDMSGKLGQQNNIPLCPCHNLPMKEHINDGKSFWGCISNKWAVYTDESLEEGRIDKERFDNQMNALIRQMDNFVERMNNG